MSACLAGSPLRERASAHLGESLAPLGAPRQKVDWKEIDMSISIYVGNLPFDTTEDALRDLFSSYGTVETVKLITDRDTGRIRGFGFVDMTNGGNEAIAALNQSDLSGRSLTVNLAKPRQERSPQPRRW
jgi:RNA recognition motif-containing protein